MKKLYNGTRLLLAVLASAMTFSVVSADAQQKALTQKPTIILVHGAFEDASVWKTVITDLKRDGYKAVAVNLPGRDGDPTPKAQITQASLRDKVVAALAGESKPVILVGHSFGGITISTVAEAVPEKINKLIYVAAYLPKNGQSLQTLSQMDRDSKLGPSFKVDPTKMIATVVYDKRTELFLNDGTPEQKKGFADTMVDEPLSPPGTPVTLTSEKFGRVRKAYIRTAKDVVVSPMLQDKMIKETPVDAVVTLNAGHTPFITKPTELTKAIETLASK